MRRIGLAVLVAFSFIAAPVDSEAQAAAQIHRIGLLESGPPSSTADPFGQWGAFREGLQTLGYVEGRSVAIESRWAGNKYERLSDLAAELVRLNVEIIVVRTTPAARAARNVTQSIPIVILSAIDPVGAGLVASLARPGGNITGLTTQAPDLSAKRVQLLKEMMPRLSRLAVLWNSANPANAAGWRETQDAARTLGVQLQSRQVEDAKDFERAFELIARERPDALLIVDDALTVGHAKQIADFAIRERLVTMLGSPAVLAGGGLIGYGPNVREMARRGAYYVDKILNGAKPADLPVEQPTKFELAINLKTAKALGLTIPHSILLRADHVIDSGRRSTRARIFSRPSTAGSPKASTRPTSETRRRCWTSCPQLRGELGMRPLVAHCHLGLGKLYRRTGKPEQAHEHLTTATTMYREMDMRFWLEKAEAEKMELT